MCVNLRRGNISVSKHFLDSPKVFTSLNELGGKGVAALMWRNFFSDS